MAACQSLREQVVEALRPVEDPELHRSIVDLGMVRNVDLARRRRRRDPDRPHGGRMPAAQRDHQPRHRRRRTARRRVADVDLDFTVMTDSEREELRKQAARRPRRDRRSGPGPRPRRRAHDPVRPSRLEDPAAADLVGQGRRRQVERHHQPGRRPGRARLLGRRRRRRHLRLLDPPHARHRPRADRDRRDARAARAAGACAASRSATSCRPARPSSGAGRCCTRRSSSS